MIKEKKEKILKRIDLNNLCLSRIYLPISSFQILTLVCLISVFVPNKSSVANNVEESSDIQVIEEFVSDEIVEGEEVAITDQEKQVVMFSMGIVLLVLVISTGVLGISMAIYGKQVFIAHMILAGLSITLAIAHSIVAIVWFFPF